MSLTAAPTQLRYYCPAIASDTTNWPDATLIVWWDKALARLKQELCPPFAEADLDKFNVDATASATGTDLIARMAAIMLYDILPGRVGREQEKLKDDLYGTRTPDGTTIGLLEKLQTGAASLFDSAGTKLSRTSAAYHSDQIAPGRVFSRTRTDSSGNLVGTTGSLDQFDKY